MNQSEKQQALKEAYEAINSVFGSLDPHPPAKMNTEAAMEAVEKWMMRWNGKVREDRRQKQ